LTRRTELRRPRKRTRPSRRKAGSRQPDPATAYDVAVRLLGQRAHSAVELARKLARRGFEDEAIGLVLDRLAELGYLDDAEYARALVNHRGGSRGAAAIAAELASKGVARPLVQAAVAELDPELELAAAERFARRWLPRAVPGSFRSLLEVAGPRLARRGFSPSVVREACRRALA